MGMAVHISMGWRFGLKSRRQTPYELASTRSIRFGQQLLNTGSVTSYPLNTTTYWLLNLFRPIVQPYSLLHKKIKAGSIHTHLSLPSLRHNHPSPFGSPAQYTIPPQHPPKHDTRCCYQDPVADWLDCFSLHCSTVIPIWFPSVANNQSATLASRIGT